MCVIDTIKELRYQSNFNNGAGVRLDGYQLKEIDGFLQGARDLETALEERIETLQAEIKSLNKHRARGNEVLDAAKAMIEANGPKMPAAFVKAFGEITQQLDKALDDIDAASVAIDECGSEIAEDVCKHGLSE